MLFDEALVDAGAVPAEQVRFQHPLSNRACLFQAHGLPTILIAWLAQGSTRYPEDDISPYRRNAAEARLLASHAIAGRLDEQANETSAETHTHPPD